MTHAMLMMLFMSKMGVNFVGIELLWRFLVVSFGIFDLLGLLTRDGPVTRNPIFSCSRHSIFLIYC